MHARPDTQAAGVHASLLLAKLYSQAQQIDRAQTLFEFVLTLEPDNAAATADISKSGASEGPGEKKTGRDGGREIGPGCYSYARCHEHHHTMPAPLTARPTSLPRRHHFTPADVGRALRLIERAADLDADDETTQFERGMVLFCSDMHERGRSALPHSAQAWTWA